MKRFITVVFLALTLSVYSQFNLALDGIKVPVSNEFECFSSPRVITIAHNDYDSLSFQDSKIRYYEYAKSSFVEKSFKRNKININSTGVIRAAFAIRKEPLVITLGKVSGYKNGKKSKIKLSKKVIKLHFKGISLQEDREYERVNSSSKIAMNVNQELITGTTLTLTPEDKVSLKLPKKHKISTGKIQFLSAPATGSGRPIGGSKKFRSEKEFSDILENQAPSSFKFDHAVMINVQLKKGNNIVQLKESLFYKLKPKKLEGQR